MASLAAILLLLFLLAPTQTVGLASDSKKLDAASAWEELNKDTVNPVTGNVLRGDILTDQDKKQTSNTERCVNVFNSDSARAFDKERCGASPDGRQYICVLDDCMYMVGEKTSSVSSLSEMPGVLGGRHDQDGEERKLTDIETIPLAAQCQGVTATKCLNYHVIDIGTALLDEGSDLLNMGLREDSSDNWVHRGQDCIFSGGTSNGKLKCYLKDSSTGVVFQLTVMGGGALEQYTLTFQHQDCSGATPFQDIALSEGCFAPWDYWEASGSWSGGFDFILEGETTTTTKNEGYYPCSTNHNPWHTTVSGYTFMVFSAGIADVSSYSTAINFSIDGDRC